MQIRYTVTAKTIEENASSFTGTGVCGDEEIVAAQFTLRHFNLGDENPNMAHADGQVIEAMKRRCEFLYPGE
jgi:hypothetical protein